MSVKIDKNHNKKLLVKFHDDFYDLSKFLEKHPGGVNTLKDLNDSDMTKKFLNAPPHSDAAIYLLKEYRIKNDNNDEIKKTLNNNQNHSNDTKSRTYKENGFNKNENFNDKFNKNDKEFICESNNQLTDESMEHLVDWSEPMVWQIHKIKSQYNEWVNKPVDRPLRLFKSSYLEICTRTPWWIVPLFWIPIIYFLIHNEIYRMKIMEQSYKINSIFTLIFYFIYGILIWTFVEYLLHRWIFHMKVSENSSLLCTFHFMLHGLHHKVPFDAYRLVFPPLAAVILALAFYPSVCIISVNPRTTMAGGLFGYVCYDMMHYYLHYGNPSVQHLYQMKRYHYQHHFVHHDRGFGISSTMWDSIFDTKIYLRKLKYILQWRL